MAAIVSRVLGGMRGSHPSMVLLCRVPSAFLKALFYRTGIHQQTANHKIFDQGVEKQLFGWVIYVAISTITPRLEPFLDWVIPIYPVSPTIGCRNRTWGIEPTQQISSKGCNMLISRVGRHEQVPTLDVQFCVVHY